MTITWLNALTIWEYFHIDYCLLESHDIINTNASYFAAVLHNKHAVLLLEVSFLTMRALIPCLHHPVVLMSTDIMGVNI
jgi:hypothetical protein